MINEVPPVKAVKAVKGLKSPRLATPRPKLLTTKGQAPLNPFGANKMTVKSASLSEFRHLQAMRKMAAHDPMAHALLAIREEQEKEANLAGKALTWGAGVVNKGKNLLGLGGKAGQTADKVTHSLASKGLEKMKGTVAKASGDAAKMQGAAVPSTVKQQAVQTAQNAAKNPSIAKADNLKQISAPAPAAKPAPAHNPTAAQQSPGEVRAALGRDKVQAMGKNRPAGNAQQTQTPAAPQAKQTQTPAAKQTPDAGQSQAPPAASQGQQPPPATPTKPATPQAAPVEDGSIGGAFSGWKAKAGIGTGLLGGGAVAGGSAVGGVSAAQTQNAAALRQGYNQGIR